MADLVQQLEVLFTDLRLLGEGATAAAYYAKSKEDEKECVVKVFLRSFDEEEGGQPLARFERECKALAKLNHPHIVALRQWGSLESLPYLVLEWAPATPLSQLVKERSRLPWRMATKLVAKLASGLAHAHSQQIIHRDIKPENILVKDDGSPLLIDFGLVRSGLMQTYQTATGVILGSPIYMAPELFGTERADEYTDVYSLAVVYHEILMGKRPFQGTLNEIIKQKLSTPPPSLTSLAGFPKSLARTVDELIALPHQRQKLTAAQFADKLSEVVEVSQIIPKTQLVRSIVGEPNPFTASADTMDGDTDTAPITKPNILPDEAAIKDANRVTVKRAATDVKARFPFRKFILFLLLLLPLLYFAFPKSDSTDPTKGAKGTKTELVGKLKNLSQQIAQNPDFPKVQTVTAYISALRDYYVYARQARPKKRRELVKEFKHLRQLIPKESVSYHLIESRFSPEKITKDKALAELASAISRFTELFTKLTGKKQEEALPLATELYSARQKLMATCKNLDQWRNLYFNLNLACFESANGRAMGRQLTEFSKELVLKSSLAYPKVISDKSMNVAAKAEEAEKIYDKSRELYDEFKSQVSKLWQKAKMYDEFKQLPAGKELTKLLPQAHWQFYPLLTDEACTIEMRHDYIEVCMSIASFYGKDDLISNYLDKKRFGPHLSPLECANRALDQLAHMTQVLIAAKSKSRRLAAERHLILAAHRWLRETRTLRFIDMRVFRRLVEERAPKGSHAQYQIASFRHYCAGRIKESLVLNKKALKAGRARFEEHMVQGGQPAGDLWNILEYSFKSRLGDLEEYSKRKEHTEEVAKLEVWFNSLSKKEGAHWRIREMWCRCIYVLYLCRKPQIDDELWGKFKEAHSRVQDKDIKNAMTKILANRK